MGRTERGTEPPTASRDYPGPVPALLERTEAAQTGATARSAAADRRAAHSAVLLRRSPAHCPPPITELQRGPNAKHCGTAGSEISAGCRATAESGAGLCVPGRAVAGPGAPAERSCCEGGRAAAL